MKKTQLKPKQLSFLKNQAKAYGGELLKTRRGRSTARPLATRQTMHLVLRSSKAKADWSFRREHHARAIRTIIQKFSQKYGVKILSLVNVGNHLHLHVKLTNRFTYPKFIRAITASITMAITGTSRWKPLKRSAKDRFWDYRPYTRVVEGFRSLLHLRDYLKINEWEGFACNRSIARVLVQKGVFAPPGAEEFQVY